MEAEAATATVAHDVSCVFVDVYIFAVGVFQMDETAAMEEEATTVEEEAATLKEAAATMVG